MNLIPVDGHLSHFQFSTIQGPCREHPRMCHRVFPARGPCGGGWLTSPTIATIAEPHLRGWPVSVVSNPDPRWQLSDFGTHATLMGATKCLLFEFLICVFLITEAETFSSFHWSFGFTLLLYFLVCVCVFFSWFLSICGSSDPGSVATISCQLTFSPYSLVF